MPVNQHRPNNPTKTPAGTPTRYQPGDPLKPITYKELLKWAKDPDLSIEDTRRLVYSHLGLLKIYLESTQPPPSPKAS